MPWPRSRQTRRSPECGHHLVGQRFRPDQHRAGVNGDAVEGQAQSRDVVGPEHRPQFQIGQPAQHRGRRVGVHHRGAVWSLAEDGGVYRQLGGRRPTFARLERPTVQADQSHVAGLGAGHPPLISAASTHEEGVIADPDRNVSEHAWGQPPVGQHPAGRGGLDALLVVGVSGHRGPRRSG